MRSFQVGLFQDTIKAHSRRPTDKPSQQDQIGVDGRDVGNSGGADDALRAAERKALADLLKDAPNAPDAARVDELRKRFEELGD